MPKVAIIDYKRVGSLFHRTIAVGIPKELVARKRTGRRGNLAAQRLKERVHAEFSMAGRRAFRGDVAIHLKLRGIPLDHHRARADTVKAILDSLEGPVYPKDRAVALLDVSLVPAGKLEAELAVCSARQYADAFDVLCGVSEDRCEDVDGPWNEVAFRDDPWAWDSDSELNRHDLEIAEENLADLEADAGYCPPDLGSSLIDRDRQRIREHKRASLLSMPYMPTDRPGPSSLAGRLWNDAKHFTGPARVFLPAPQGKGSEGSWTAIAREAFTAHFEAWQHVIPLLEDESLALDIAVGRQAAKAFDVDNLATRVLRAFHGAVPQLPRPPAYRVYRRHGDDNAVVVVLHHLSRAANLRHLLSGSPLAVSGLRPDPDGPSYRRRPIDDELYNNTKR